ncbi:MAG: orotidine-5'-phosphate decarboxylase [Calditrichaeota bacterium]|nr:orotidine-5'-phosphate decarboxylase [Calditrichota bacterium]
MDFALKLKDLKYKFNLCVGLDPVWDKLPEHIRSAEEPLLAFCSEIIEKTQDIATAYKPNLAFFEAFGPEGWKQLGKIISLVPDNCIVIADGKRGDIGSTAVAYAKSLFETLGCDAATVSPYLGGDSIEPFLKRVENGAFILALTTNPGGSDLQELVCDDEPLYIHVVRLARRLNKSKNVGLVVGATKTQLWQKILETAVDLPLLIPGIGAQGGDIDALKSELKDYAAPAFINASRSIIYASSDKDFGSKARDAAFKLYDRFND